MDNENALGLPPQQFLFLGFVVVFFIDLVLLNLFSAYWSYVHIESFAVSIGAAAIIKILLQLTIRLERTCAEYFAKQKGRKARIKRAVVTMHIVALSKFVILGVLYLILGDAVAFSGPINGVVAFIAVIITIIATENLFKRLYLRLSPLLNNRFKAVEQMS